MYNEDRIFDVVTDLRGMLKIKQPKVHHRLMISLDFWHFIWLCIHLIGLSAYFWLSTKCICAFSFNIKCIVSNFNVRHRTFTGKCLVVKVHSTDTVSINVEGLY